MLFNQQKTDSKSKQFLIVMTCIIVGVCGRVMPHFPNVTPMTSLSLFAGSTLKRPLALVSMLVTFIISDVLLSFIYGYPLFSAWTLFVYSGFALITVCGKTLAKHFKWQLFPAFIGATSLLYWLWTNFGVWLTSGMYAKNLSGLFTCYAVALPFLRNALIGDFIWSAVIFGSFALICYYKKNKREWRNWQTRWI